MSLMQICCNCDINLRGLQIGWVWTFTIIVNVAIKCVVILRQSLVFELLPGLGSSCPFLNSSNTNEGWLDFDISQCQIVIRKV